MKFFVLELWKKNDNRVTLRVAKVKDMKNVKKTLTPLVFEQMSTHIVFLNGNMV